MVDASSRLHVYGDVDVLIASAASPSEHSAGQVVLSLSEVTLIDAITSELAVEECRGTLSATMPDAVPTFELLVTRSLDVVPAPSRSSVRRHTGRADWNDVPHGVAAREHDCTHLVSYNTRDYEPGHCEVQILTPGTFVRHIRERLSRP